VTAADGVGRHEEALSLAKELIAKLNAADADLILGVVLVSLAMMVRERDFSRCTALLDQAAELARANEATVDEAKCRALLAWSGTRILPLQARFLLMQLHRPAQDSRFRVLRARAGIAHAMTTAGEETGGMAFARP
jgi:hypothetical protein